MIHVLMVDGTWAPHGGSAPAEALRRALDPKLCKFDYVNYPATYGPATGIGDPSYAESVRIGMRQLRDAVRATDLPVVVAAYSQGAAAAVRFARDILPAAHDLDVRAVATMGDPHQVRHQGRSGIAGPLSTPRPRLSVYAPGDPIADLPDGCPLRSIADLTEWMSLQSMQAGEEWAIALWDRIIAERDLQAWWRRAQLRDLSNAGMYAINYMTGENHMRHYVSGGHAKRLARMIEGVAQ